MKLVGVLLFLLANPLLANDARLDLDLPTNESESEKPIDKYEQAKEKLRQRWKEMEREEQRRKLASEEPSPKDTATKLEDAFMGAKQEEIEDLKAQLAEDDIRNNVLEVQVAPGIMYVESDSPYYYRDYRTYSPSLALSAKIWLSPYMGFHASYTTSTGADVVDDLNGSNQSIVSHEIFQYSLSRRKFLSAGSSFLEFSLDYKSYNFKVPSDSSYRANIKSNFYGFGFSYTDKIHHRLSKQWLIKLYMFGSESEDTVTTNFRSGELNKSYSVQIQRQWKYRINRKHSFFINLQYIFDTHIYEGQATPADPKTGSNLEGVDVDTSFGLFQLGYEWGS
tara:strand:+ start:9640 stop:10647 length:1008 start_codon:yes stop_codon:yes gene_type:complete